MSPSCQTCRCARGCFLGKRTRRLRAAEAEVTVAGDWWRDRHPLPDVPLTVRAEAHRDWAACGYSRFMRTIVWRAKLRYGFCPYASGWIDRTPE